MSYICSCCGFITSTTLTTASSCSLSPTKTHIYMNESSTGYICQYCGFEPNNIRNTATSCSCSPHKSHIYIAKKNDGLIWSSKNGHLVKLL